MKQGEVKIVEAEPAKTIDEWLQRKGNEFEPWSNYAMLHRSLWHYARLKSNGVVVSIGAGPTPETAKQDVWDNLPKARR